MADYSAQIALAKRLIREKGRSVTLQLLSSTPDDADRPWRGPDVTDLVAETATLYAVAVPPSSASSLGLSHRTDDLVKNQGQILIAEVGEDDPENLGAYHQVEEADDSVWRILFVEQLKPADQTILYFIGVAR